MMPTLRLPRLGRARVLDTAPPSPSRAPTEDTDASIPTTDENATDANRSADPTPPPSRAGTTPLPRPAAAVVPGLANAYLLRGAFVVILLEAITITQLVNHLATYKQPPPVVPYAIAIKDPEKIVVSVRPVPMDVSTLQAIAHNEIVHWLQSKYKITQDPQEMSAAWDTGGYLYHHSAKELFDALTPTFGAEWAAARDGKTNRRVDITNVQPITESSYRAFVTLTIEDSRKPAAQAKLGVEKYAIRLDFDWRPQPLPPNTPVWKAPNATGWTATGFTPTRVYD
jgi:hypothetical protein